MNQRATLTAFRNALYVREGGGKEQSGCTCPLPRGSAPSAAGPTHPAGRPAALQESLTCSIAALRDLVHTAATLVYRHQNVNYSLSALKMASTADDRATTITNGIWNR